MKYLVDPHTHTIASGHAYNTIDEMSKAAAAIGIANIGITDHAPKMPGSSHLLYFSSLFIVPEDKFGIKRLMGTEVNIMDYNGRLDMKNDMLEKMRLVIASYHIPCIEPADKVTHTKGLINIMNNPYVNIIGHPDDVRYQVDMATVVKAAKDKHILLEVNNASLKPEGPRIGAYDNDLEMLRLCKKMDVPVVFGSDAHIAESIADFGNCEKVAEAADFPERLIANCDMDLFNSYLNRKNIC